MTDKTTKRPKLTTAQKSLLNQVCMAPLEVIESYAPAVKLIAYGLAEGQKRAFGRLLISPTLAGLNEFDGAA